MFGYALVKQKELDDLKTRISYLETHEKVVTREIGDKEMTPDLLDTWARVNGYMVMPNLIDRQINLIPENKAVMKSEGGFW